MAKPFTLEGMQEVADTIQGTCRSLDEVVREVFEDDDLEFTMIPLELLQSFDNMVEECQVCGWWCEVCEMSEEQEGTCKDCAEGEE